MRRLASGLTVLVALAATEAVAVTLYKLVDEQGRVTYTDNPPAGFDGLAVPLQIDPDEHSVRLVGPEGAPPPAPFGVTVERVPATEAAGLNAARERLAIARADLEVARESSTAADWIYFGPNNPLGMRRAPRPEYRARLERLEAEVRRAEADVEEAEERLRLAAR